MTDALNDGGPVYPELHRTMTPAGMIEHDFTSGMTLRDWFAGQAPPAPGWRMDGECPTPPPGWKEGDGAQRWEELRWAFMLKREALWRWSYADAMIAARDKTGAA